MQMMQLLRQYGCIYAHSRVIVAIQLNCNAYESQSTIRQPMKDNDYTKPYATLHDVKRREVGKGDINKPSMKKKILETGWKKEGESVYMYEYI